MQELKKLYEKCLEQLDEATKVIFNVGKDYPDSIPGGSLVEKTIAEEGDLTPLGTPGIVLGCRDVSAEYKELSEKKEISKLNKVKYAYLVAFIFGSKEQIRITFVVDFKIKEKKIS